MMTIATTGALSADPDDPIVYRGPYEQIFPQMAEDGYDAVELHIQQPGDFEPEALHALLSRHGLRLTSIGTGSIYFSNGWSIADQDPAIRNACIEHLEAHMRLAAPSGGVVIIGCVQGRLVNCPDPDLFHEYMAESLHRLDGLSAQHGVRIGFEVMNRFESDWINRIEEGVALLTQLSLPNTCLHIDTVHLNIEEADIGAAIRMGKGYIGHVHIADNDRWYPGHAHYDFDETLAALAAIGYDGALALETNCFPDTRTSACRSLAFLRARLSKS